MRSLTGDGPGPGRINKHISSYRERAQLRSTSKFDSGAWPRRRNRYRAGGGGGAAAMPEQCDKAKLGVARDPQRMTANDSGMRCVKSLSCPRWSTVGILYPTRCSDLDRRPGLAPGQVVFGVSKHVRADAPQTLGAYEPRRRLLVAGREQSGDPGCTPANDALSPATPEAPTLSYRDPDVASGWWDLWPQRHLRFQRVQIQWLTGGVGAIGAEALECCQRSIYRAIWASSA